MFNFFTFNSQGVSLLNFTQQYHICQIESNFITIADFGPLKAGSYSVANLSGSALGMELASYMHRTLLISRATFCVG